LEGSPLDRATVMRDHPRMDEGNAAVIAGALALMGAVIGGGAAIWGAKLGADKAAKAAMRQVAVQANFEHRQWLREQRLKIYTSVLSSWSDMYRLMKCRSFAIQNSGPYTVSIDLVESCDAYLEEIRKSVAIIDIIDGGSQGFDLLVRAGESLDMLELWESEPEGDDGCGASNAFRYHQSIGMALHAFDEFTGYANQAIVPSQA
jgi:hypothetical protein